MPATPRASLRLSGLLALLLLATTPATAQPDPQPDNADAPVADAIATVAFAGGFNRVRRGADGRLERASADLPIYAGDTITVSARGRVTIVYSPSGVYRSIAAGEEATITGELAAEQQDVDMDRVSKAMVRSLHSQEEGTLAAVGGTRDRRTPYQPFMRSPRNTLLFPGDPVRLAWEPPDGPAPTYEVVVMAEGRLLVRERVAGASHLDVDPARLQAGTLYYWYVMRTDRPVVPASKAMFRMTGADEADRLQAQIDANAQLAVAPGDFAPHFMNARLLYQASMYADALALYRQVYAAAPGDEGLLRAMRAVWRAMGFYPEDIERFEQELRHAHPAVLPAHNLRASAEGRRVTLTWAGSEHEELIAYRVHWWRAGTAEPAPDAIPDAQQTEVPVDGPGGEHVTTIELPAAGSYTLRVVSTGLRGQPLEYADRPEDATITVEVH